jgi:hypothetical protein
LALTHRPAGSASWKHHPVSLPYTRKPDHSGEVNTEATLPLLDFTMLWNE